MKLNIKKLYKDVKLPVVSKDNSGIDIYTHKIDNNPFSNYLTIHSGLSIEPEEGFYFNLVPRSSSFKKGLQLYNSVGIIDNSYRGEIIAVFLKTKDFFEHTLKLGERLFQLVPQKVIEVDIEEVQELKDSMRGNNGFGSSGE